MCVGGLFDFANMALSFWQAITCIADTSESHRPSQKDHRRNAAGGDPQNTATMAHIHRLNAKGAETPWSSSLRMVT